jgi:hypothetical protein
MTHDPICPMWSKVFAGDVCDCDLIDKVRQDMLAKCIAAVEDLHPKHCFPSDHPYQMRRAAVAALRAPQEQR